jgi:alkanesulfonate monooxygenase SsuD/methylene tetrahydromethanopterin reductase-like flavin-dependent oxidoreductase (luciferase family)
MRIAARRPSPSTSMPARSEALRSPRGALAVGSPEQVAEKLLFEHELFGHDRYMAQMSVGAVAHHDVLRSIELFGTEVAPIVLEEVTRRETRAPVGT